MVRNIPGVSLLIENERFKRFRHFFIRNFANRDPYTLTRFCRLPAQYELLAGQVMDYILPKLNGRELRIASIGCSKGSEPYSVASILLQRRPGVPFSISAYDYDPEMIAKAKERRFAAKEVFNNPALSGKFVDFTFEREPDGLFRVRDEVASHIRFELADALDPGLVRMVGQCDILYAQNLMNNMKPRMAKRAFGNIITLLRPQGALFIDGMDLGMKTTLVGRAGLLPVEEKIEEIYGESKAILNGWPVVYSGLEPFSKSRSDWKMRYSTVYIR